MKKKIRKVDFLGFISFMQYIKIIWISNKIKKILISSIGVYMGTNEENNNNFDI